MKTLSILKDFGLTDAGNEAKVRNIIGNISIGNNANIKLDLTDCIIDYPATSMIIDKILEELAQLTNKKKLYIDVSYFLPEQTLLNDLLGDSKFFSIQARTEMPIEDLKKRIIDTIKPCKIEIAISIKDRKGEIKKQYIYGN